MPENDAPSSPAKPGQECHVLQASPNGVRGKESAFKYYPEWKIILIFEYVPLAIRHRIEIEFE